MTMPTSFIERGLAGNTKISLLDGSNPTIQELTENFNQDYPNYIYTLSKTGITIGPVFNFKLIGQNVETVVVTLNSNETICCSPNFNFILRDGTFKEAKDLQPNESLMPLYKNYSRKNGGGYERIYDPINNCKRYTHRMVMKYWLRLKSIPAGYEVHHKKDRTNNDPRELELLPSLEHRKLHKKDYKELNRRSVEQQNIKQVISEAKKRQNESVGITLLCNVAAESHSVAEVCRKLNITTLEIKQIIEKFSISYRNFLMLLCKQRVRAKKNHKVICIGEGPITDIYDLSVQATNNFALFAGVFVCSND